ncbi:MAG: ABC transporter ATP-binding protein [Streptosporangiaceae bacterium]|nr:ABC transporter ATP-binding protein [Streptosporangiaceae bacterium]
MKVAKAARFLFALAAKLDRRRLIGAMLIMLAGYSAAPLAALSLAVFADDLIGRRGQAALAAALLAAAFLVIQLMGGHFSHLCSGRLYEHQLAALNIELIEIVGRPPGIEHLDDPEFADQIDLIRNSLFGTAQALESLFSLTGLALQTAITISILIRIDPWLAFMPAFAVPAMLLGKHAQTISETARLRCAEGIRLNRHFVVLATSISTAKELRLFGAEAEILRRQETLWDGVTNRMWRAQAAAAALRSLGQLIFTLGAAGTVLLTVRLAQERQMTIGSLLLVIILLIQVNAQMAMALTQLSVLQAAGGTAERITRLRRVCRARTAVATRRTATITSPLAGGITLDDVSFAYPGSSELVLDRVSLDMPAGHTIALVGENGAGKSTLAKLLCGLYSPTSGKILIDGVDLADVAPDEWRAQVAAMFQDFARLEFVTRETIGLGELPLLSDERAIARAVSRARADKVVAHIPGGLDGVVGHNYKQGADLSGGQWQILALARCLMREHPLLLVLDEPAAALDATAEHELFERYACSAKCAAVQLGGVTVLITHRFSTVLMADRIAVLERGRIREYGSHQRLIADNALYAELYRLQEQAHRS